MRPGGAPALRPDRSGGKGAPMSESQSNAVAPSGQVAAGRIPLWLKLVYSAFMAVLIPVYWSYYGPTNFLYFCDVALILTFVGIWIESPLLVSMCAVGIVLPQTVWVIDFVAHFFGVSLLGMTDYMFKDTSVFLRGLSLFHGWIPFLLLYLVATLGYDRRALLAWTALATLLILVCFFFMPPLLYTPIHVLFRRIMPQAPREATV